MDNKDLNELIGILDSINYDEIINSLEIESLKKWIDNHSHVQDYDLNSIIIKLKKILEDNIVSEQEINDILVIVADYSKKQLSEYERIFILNGIIKGIVTDGVVNSKEINTLQFWLLNNVDLSKYNSYQKIFDFLKKLDVNKFDENYILTSFRLILLQNNINDKTQVLKYKIDNKKLIGNDLINLLGEESIIKKIHYTAINELKNLLKNRISIIESDYESIIISLSLIALLDYDGSFWKYVESIYAELYKKHSNQRINGKIREIIKTFNKEYSDESRVINYVLENAIVPKKFASSYFDFIYDIYKYNFDCSLIDKNLDEEFEFVFDGLRSSLTKEKDTDELSVKVTSKTYKLIKSTKNVIINNETKEEIIKLSKSIVKIIDNYYWNNRNICGENVFFNYGFNEWLKSINIEVEKSENKKSTKRFVSSWKPEYVLDGTKIYLVPPIHKIKSEYNYQYIRVVVECDGEVIYENSKPEIYDMFGGYKVIVDKIKIENPFANIKYLVYCDNQIIYDSNDNLYRKNLIFKYDQTEYKNNTDYSGQLIIAKKEVDSNLAQVYFKSDFYQLGFKNVKNGDTFSLDDELINLSTKLECGIVGKYLQAKIYSDLEYPVYSSVDKYIIETTESPNNIGIMINNQRNRLVDFDYQLKSRGGYTDYIINLNLEKNNLFNIYSFKINDESEISKSRICFAYISDIDYTCDQYDNENYRVNVKSDIFDNDISYMLNIKQNKKLAVKCFIKNKEYDLYIPLQLKLFKLDDREWQTFDDYIWAKDVDNYSKLYVYGIESDYIVAKGNKSITISTIYNKTKDNIINTFDVGSSIANNYEDDSIKIVFYKNNNILDYLTCYCKTVLSNPDTVYSFDSSSAELSIKPKFYGKGKVQLSIMNDDQIVYFKEQIESEHLITIKDLSSFVNYQIELKELNEELSFEEDNIIYSNNVILYSNKDLVGRYFNLSYVTFSQTIRGIFQSQSMYLKNTYLAFNKQVESNLFEGTIYSFKNGIKKVFKTCNPVEIELMTNAIDDIMEISITYEGDGLLLDFVNKTILDADDPKATDIYSYKMDLRKGGITWQN